MITISKPLSAAQAQRYHAEEFANARANYYTHDDRIRGTWHGTLAGRWGLEGEVREEHFQRLAHGQDPRTGDRLVRHQQARTYVNAHGDTVTASEHRAGWDVTVSAPKSISLTALVGGDMRVLEAHYASATVALDELEHYVQARLGGNRPAETTGQWIAARFEHDSARPVDGYAAPQLHTHVVVFNVSETADGDAHALQPRELFKSQQYATAVYRSELASRVRALGYEIDHGSSGQPEIRGYSEAYLEAASPRRRQIEAYLAQENRAGAAAAQIAAHQTREAKLDVTREEVHQHHRWLAEAFGNQPAQVVQAAHERTPQLQHDSPQIGPHAAVTFAKERNLEREAIVDERHLLGDACRRSMGELTIDQIKTEFERRVAQAEFVRVEQPPGTAGRAFTTREMLALERETIAMMQAGQEQHAPLIAGGTRRDIDRDYGHLNEHQRAAVQQMFASRDQVMALEGVAGAGKTTTLAAIRDAAERDGYQVQGFAPTSRAAQQLSESGIVTSTLQRHLARGEPSAAEQKNLYVLDEASLASTAQIHAFFRRLGADDRVLLVGDVRQHQAIEAGRPYQQLQDAGIDIVRLNEIVRQRDPALRAVVAELSRGEVHPAVEHLDAQGRIHHIPDRGQRFGAIALDYVQHPNATLVVSPDNASRTDLNQIIHCARQAAGQVQQEEHRARVLVPRQDLTGADRRWAARYTAGDIVRYSKGSRTFELHAGDYARVERVNTDQNLLLVTRETGRQLTYDPRRLHGVTVYRESQRAFAVGDRIQLTAPDHERKLANRQLGTVESIDAHHQVTVRFDSGRTVPLSLDRDRHLDHGYAVTSHSSQGLTAERVLVHVDTAHSETLVNRRFAYVAVSRGRIDAQLYTNDKSQVAYALGREVSHRSALEMSAVREQSAPQIQPSSSSPHTPEPAHARQHHAITR
jgi:conjugative relaxase-like TrwC/TraI family protein